MTTITMHLGDVRDVMNTLEDNSADLLVTSPPFLALRSYLPADHPDKHREIGSEPTPAAFIDTMLGLTADWRRIVTDTGTIAVEIGDTYSGAGGYGSPDAPNPAYGQPRFEERWTGRTAKRFKRKDDGWPESKSLTGIPTLYTWSLAYGRNLLTGTESPAGQWRIRNLLTWTRPNPPVGALGDKFRPATSFVTVACTSHRRWFDLDAVRTGELKPRGGDSRPGGKRADAGVDAGTWSNNGNPAGAPPLDWWDATDLDPDELDAGGHDWQPLHRLATAPYKGAHYATYPVALPMRLIEAMCPREVCMVCGEPRRRVVADKSAFSRQPELAAHIKERREALGITSAQINERLGYKEIAKNWERTDKRGAAVPNARDWAVIKPWLGLSDEFDEMVTGERRWTESTLEYVDGNGQQVEAVKWTSGIPEGKGAHSNYTGGSYTRVAPDAWTDCGCIPDDYPTSAVTYEYANKYRPGIVLDPFGGSGTTAIAAATTGRDAILIDLDSRNVELVRERIINSLRLVDEHRDGDTITWTVEPPLPAQRDVDPNQTSIFDLEPAS